MSALLEREGESAALERLVAEAVAGGGGLLGDGATVRDAAALAGLDEVAAALAADALAQVDILQRDTTHLARALAEPPPGLGHG